MKILFLNYDVKDACAYYRSAGIAKDLAKQAGVEITVLDWKDWERYFARYLLDYDAIMLQRPCTKNALAICEKANEYGIKIIIDHDDDLLSVPPHHVNYATYAGSERQGYVKGCLELADVVTVTNKALQEVYGAYNKNTIIVPNALNSDKPKRAANDANVIAWRGGDSHRLDIQSVSKEINAATMRFRDWKFAYMGNKPIFLPKFPNVEHILPMKVQEYMDYLYNFAPKVLQVPLVDDKFNRGKSECAGIEAVHCGSACLVPSWWEIPAIKYSTPEEYATSLNAMLSGEIDLTALNALAWEYVQDNWLLENVNKIRCEILRNL